MQSLQHPTSRSQSRRSVTADGEVQFELAAVQYRAALTLYARGRVSFDQVVGACRALAIASRNYRRQRRRRS
jgi:hypothetical protein